MNLLGCPCSLHVLTLSDAKSWPNFPWPSTAECFGHNCRWFPITCTCPWFLHYSEPLLSANVSGLKHGFLHYGHGSLLSVWLPHEPHSHCLNKALSRSINVSNSLYCKSGVEAKAKSITQIHHHFKQNYDLWVIHDSINCLLFPVLSEILATIESLGIINSWRRWRQKQFLD